MYLDPGAWSLVVQVLVGALVSIPILLGLYWGRIRERLTRAKTGSKLDD